MYEISKLLEEANLIEKELAKELFGILDFYKLTTNSYKTNTKLNLSFVENYKKKNKQDNQFISQVINNENEKMNRYPNIVLKMGFIYAVAHYESFWSDIVRLIFKVNYRKFLNSKKTVTYKFLLDINDKKTIIENLIDKEVKDFGYKNINDQFESINENYKFNFEEEEGENKWMESPNAINYSKIGEIFATRNLIMHNRGIVNRTYLNLVPNSEFNIEEERQISEKYMSDSIYLLGVTSNKIIEKLKSKYN
ncbi:hypothetical protein [Algibacter lectus]|uniref:RiboL-PSP-HEPN domain-containing protein n=1 Tax=Algibacter lectus TaxID=221126 RepID=A0A090WC67_9FLAO|nr:hypothetical protein [Algibacter lectus]GAL65147.1 hypothetical protein JCM19300_2026 [Algibacter lectus]